MGPKRNVRGWETVETFVTTFPSDDGEGACDVEVQIGELDGGWFLRTKDDAGGSDEAPDTHYRTRAAAEKAARKLAKKLDEANGRDAETYLRMKTEKRRGTPDPRGKWACYWDTVSEDESGPHERFATRSAAEAAVELANEALHQRHRGHLLAGFEVRQLAGGKWRRVNDDDY